MIIVHLGVGAKSPWGVHQKVKDDANWIGTDSFCAVLSLQIPLNKVISQLQDIQGVAQIKIKLLKLGEGKQLHGDDPKTVTLMVSLAFLDQ